MTHVEESNSSKSTLTIRLIRSFAHRNVRPFVIRDVDLHSTSVKQLMDRVKRDISGCHSLPPPFRSFSFDCMKIEHKAHGAKTSDAVIRLDKDQQLLLTDLDKTLIECGIEHETEISFFRQADYQDYKLNPSSVLVN